MWCQKKYENSIKGVHFIAFFVFFFFVNCCFNRFTLYWIYKYVFLKEKAEHLGRLVINGNWIYMLIRNDKSLLKTNDSEWISIRRVSKFRNLKIYHQNLHFTLIKPIYLMTDKFNYFFYQTFVHFCCVKKKKNCIHLIRKKKHKHFLNRYKKCFQNKFYT